MTLAQIAVGVVEIFPDFTPEQIYIGRVIADIAIAPTSSPVWKESYTPIILYADLVDLARGYDYKGNILVSTEKGEDGRYGLIFKEPRTITRKLTTREIAKSVLWPPRTQVQTVWAPVQ